jgi:hypothetical protein
MKDAFLNNARKWGVGVCLILWCCVGYSAMAAPAVLIYAGFVIASSSEGFLSVGTWLATLCFIILVPLIACHFGRAFGLRYDKIPPQGL